MVLVTGANGQLGHDVVRELNRRNIENIGLLRYDLDITDFVKVDEYISSKMPEAVIHCAAYTAVDKAEDEEDLCYTTNVTATENIAKACKTNDIKIVKLSYFI